MQACLRKAPLWSASPADLAEKRKVCSSSALQRNGNLFSSGRRQAGGEEGWFAKDGEGVLFRGGTWEGRGP